MNRTPIKPVWVTTSTQLEEILKEVLETKSVSRFLFINDWDTPCVTLKRKLKAIEKFGNDEVVYVVDNFDIPMGLGILRDAIRSSRNVNTTTIQNYTGVPMMVRVHGDHGNYPVPVTYTGSIFAELGL